MPSANSLLTLATAVSSASAAYQGFNYGATFTDGSIKAQSDYEAEFKAAAGLEGTDGKFTSARLYTMIQGDSANNQPIAAIPAAIKTKTSLLFGLWASGGDAQFAAEIEALTNTIDQYCDQLDDLVAGISVGSEDLYRISPTGIAAGENPGVGPDVLVNYISKVRETIKGSCLSDVPIGHVDTWNAYSNASNNALIEACDWLGMDTYPYFEDTKDNEISEGLNLFTTALDKVKAAGGSKEVWITESGWPISGKVSGKAVASTENARTFWEEVGCSLFGTTNTWWYTLQDAAPDTPNPSFGILSDLDGKPAYDLSCDNVSKAKTSTKAASSKTATASDSTATIATKGSDDDDSKKAATKVSASGSASGSAATSAATPASSVVSGTGSSNASATGTPSGSATPVATPSSSSGSGTSGSGSGSSSSDSTDGTATPSAVTEGSGAQLNSFGAAAVAIVLAAAIL